jgi:hypothetical protein
MTESTEKKNSLEGVKTFFTKEDKDAHPQFQVWRKLNPNGYFLARKSESTGVLHRANCKQLATFKTVEECGADLTEEQKSCSKSIAKLEQWAVRNGITKVNRCTSCKPN